MTSKAIKRITHPCVACALRAALAAWGPRARSRAAGQRRRCPADTARRSSSPTACARTVPTSRIRARTAASPAGPSSTVYGIVIASNSEINPAPRVPVRRAVVRKLQSGGGTEPPLSGEHQPRGARVREAHAQARRAQLSRPEVQRRPEKQTTTQRHQSAVPGIPQGAEGSRGSAERRRRLEAIGVGSLRGCQSVSAVLVSAAPVESKLRSLPTGGVQTTACPRNGQSVRAAVCWISAGIRRKAGYPRDAEGTTPRELGPTLACADRRRGFGNRRIRSRARSGLWSNAPESEDDRRAPGWAKACPRLADANDGQVCRCLRPDLRSEPLRPDLRSESSGGLDRYKAVNTEREGFEPSYREIPITGFRDRPTIAKTPVVTGDLSPRERKRE
jgi:hypothetical protein